MVMESFGGRRQVTPEEFNEAIQSLRPDVAAVIHEPPGRVTASQFYLADDGATEAAARRACREGRFVDARRRPGSTGDYVEISVSRLAGAPLLLPRRAVERSLAARTVRRRIALEASATPRF